MKKTQRKLLSLALCCALLCSLLVLPAQAATGSVTDAVSGAAVAGATALCQVKKSDGTWADWIGVIDPKPGDPTTSQTGMYGADYYGQNNPMDTDSNGRYGWLMPPGTYRVRITARGYEEYVSPEFIVGGEAGALAPGGQVNAALVKEGSGGGGDTPGGEETPPPGGEETPPPSGGGDTPGGGSSSGGSSSGGSSGGSSSSGSSFSSRPDTEALVKGNLPSGEVQPGSRLTLKAKNSRITIYYTTDGTDPTQRSSIYRSPIPISGDMTVKIAAAQNNVLGSVVTYTYTQVPSPVVNTPPAPKLGTLRFDAPSVRYLKGYADGTFRPDQPATRYEVVDALSRLVVLDTGDSSHPFTDVESSRAQTVARMVRAGLINGMTPDTFQGEEPMTRCQLCKVLTLVLELEPGSAQTDFPDVQSHWAAPYIAALTQAGYIKGYLDGSFRPDRPVTRAELAVLLNRVAGRENVPAGSYVYQDLPLDFWGYQDIQNAAL